MTKKGFNLELHKQILIKMLVDIFKKFGGRLGFKGGTCAYLFYDRLRSSAPTPAGIGRNHNLGYGRQNSSQAPDE